MYKILLADDEGIVIEALTFILEKHFKGQYALQATKTGRGLIENAEQFNPDIALVDIHMPGINGIEAIKEIKKTNQNTLFILLSAYDKFDYAQEAINLGVWSYLNKPVDQDVIVQTIKSAMAKIDADKQKRNQDLMIKERLEIVAPIVETNFIYAILFQDDLETSAENFTQLLGIASIAGFMMVLKFGDSLKNGRFTNVVGVSVRAQSLYHSIKEIIKDFFGGYVGAMMANMIVTYVPFDEFDKVNEYESRIQVIEKARKMIDKLTEKSGVEFRVGFGTVKPILDAKESYIEAMNALHYSDSMVVHAKDLPIQCGYEKNYPVNTEKALFKNVQAGDANGAVVEATHFFNWMVSNYPQDEMNIKLKILEFVLFAEKYCYDSGGMTYHFESRKDYLSTINATNNQEELLNWFCAKIREAAGNILTKKNETSVNMVEKSKKFIQENYSKDISLDVISREANISPYYFSKLFKDETGENFIEYLTNIRMSKAKELLCNTNKSIKEICKEVGYSDPNYFSRSFKKKVGLSPTEFKEHAV